METEVQIQSTNNNMYDSGTRLGQGEFLAALACRDGLAFVWVFGQAVRVRLWLSCEISLRCLFVTGRNHADIHGIIFRLSSLVRTTIPVRTELRSSHGDRAVSLEFHQPSPNARQTGLETTFAITGRHYDGDHEHEFHLRIDGLWLDVARLTEFRDFIRGWVERPIESLAASALDGDHLLTMDDYQRVAFRFGERPDVISDSKPVVTVEYKAASLQGTYYFVTDQSCISLFSADLTSVITAVGG